MRTVDPHNRLYPLDPIDESGEPTVAHGGGHQRPSIMPVDQYEEAMRQGKFEGDDYGGPPPRPGVHESVPYTPEAYAAWEAKYNPSTRPLKSYGPRTLTSWGGMRREAVADVNQVFDAKLKRFVTTGLITTQTPVPVPTPTGEPPVPQPHYS